jgi:hypothetical protein
MIHIRCIDEMTTDTSLSFKIDMLDKAEKEYQGFRIRIANDNWIDIPLKKNEDNCSNIYTFTNLLGGYIYKVEGQYKINDIWYDAIGSLFPTKSNNSVINMMLSPHKGGSIINV